MSMLEPEDIADYKEPYNREQEQCNHCQHAEWDYGVSVRSGWYVCGKRRNTKLNFRCGDFEHFKGKLIRKQWLR